VEAGQNATKREPSARGYSWAALILGDMNTWTWTSRLGKSQMRQNMNTDVTALARPRSNCTSKLDTHPLVREGAQNEETHNYQTES
jgi:hypothetical protein